MFQRQHPYPWMQHLKLVKKTNKTSSENHQPRNIHSKASIACHDYNTRVILLASSNLSFFLTQQISIDIQLNLTLTLCSWFFWSTSQRCHVWWYQMSHLVDVSQLALIHIVVVAIIEFWSIRTKGRTKCGFLTPIVGKASTRHVEANVITWKETKTIKIIVMKWKT